MGGSFLKRISAGLALVAASVFALFVFASCDPQARLTLRFSTWSSPEEMEIMERCISAFERHYPNIRLVHEIHTSNYLDKILTSMAAGAPPDVILLDSIHIPTFVEQNVLIDLSPYAERVELDLDSFYPNVLEIARVDGKLYAFPKDFTPLVYFYNKRLFDLTETPYPEYDWTWDDFLRICIRLTGDDDGDGRLDRFGTNLSRDLFRWQPWIWNAGGDILSPDGATAISYFDSPEAVTTFTFLADLVRTHQVTPRYESLKGMSSGYDRAQKMFYSGRLGLLASGHWWIPKLRKYMQREMMSVGIVPFPRLNKDAEPVTVMFESGWAVPVATKHRRWAIRLAAFMAGEESQRIRADSGLAIPAMRRIAEEAARRDPTGLSQDFIRLVPYCRQPWGSIIPKFTTVEDIIPEIFDRVLLNGEDVESAASDLARRIDRVLPDGS